MFLFWLTAIGASALAARWACRGGAGFVFAVVLFAWLARLLA